MKPIAMKCTQQDWEDIKPILEKHNINHNNICNLIDFPYLVNNNAGYIGKISNIPNIHKTIYNRTVYEEWNKNTFLEACDIKTKFTIEDLANGKCAVINDGTVDELNKVLEDAFPNSLAQGDCKFYIANSRKTSWLAYDKLEGFNLPTQSVKDFIIEEEFKLPRNWYFKVTPENYEKFKHLRFLPILIDGYVTSMYHENLKWGYFTQNIKSRHWVDYEEITFEQFCKYVLKQEIKTNMDNRFPFSLNPKDAQKIIDSACSQWKTRLATQWAVHIVTGVNITIFDECYKEMRKACTAEQNALFDNIFGKDVEECPYKIGDYLFFNNTLIKINNIIYDKFYGSWISHTPKLFTGGGFGYDAYKDRIRLATKQEVLQAINPYRDGDLIFIKNNSTGNWGLRYTNGVIDKNGNIQCYDKQKTTGSILHWAYHKPAPGVKLPD